MKAYWSILLFLNAAMFVANVVIANATGMLLTGALAVFCMFMRAVYDD